MRIAQSRFTNRAHTGLAKVRRCCSAGGSTKTAEMACCNQHLDSFNDIKGQGATLVRLGQGRAGIGESFSLLLAHWIYHGASQNPCLI